MKKNILILFSIVLLSNCSLPNFLERESLVKKNREIVLNIIDSLRNEMKDDSLFVNLDYIIKEDKHYLQVSFSPSFLTIFNYRNFIGFSKNKSDFIFIFDSDKMYENFFNKREIVTDLNKLRYLVNNSTSIQTYPIIFLIDKNYQLIEVEN